MIYGEIANIRHDKFGMQIVTLRGGLSLKSTVNIYF